MPGSSIAFLRNRCRVGQLPILLPRIIESNSEALAFYPKRTSSFSKSSEKSRGYVVGQKKKSVRVRVRSLLMFLFTKKWTTPTSLKTARVKTESSSQFRRSSCFDFGELRMPDRLFLLQGHPLKAHRIGCQRAARGPALVLVAALGMSWATTTSRSDDDQKYHHTKLLPRVVHEGTPRKFGKVWELKAPLREARWKDELSAVAWPSEQVLHNGRVKVDSNVSQASVRSLVSSLYVAEKPSKPLIPLHKSSLRIPTLGFQDFERFAEELRTNQTVRTLDLSNNALGNQGVKYFAESIKHNTFLAHIILWGNSIGDQGCYYLADSLRYNNTLKSIQLGHNRITSDGACALLEALQNNVGLEGLFLEGNQLDEACDGSFCPFLSQNKKLVRLNLRHNKLGPLVGKDIALGLEHNRTLEALYLENNNLGDEGAFALANSMETNETLRSCHTNKNRMSKEGYAALQARSAKRYLEKAEKEKKKYDTKYDQLLRNLEDHK